MILGLSPYFILMDLYIYSIFGWIYECTFASIRSKKWINRGFLAGPVLPLYGFGGTLVYVFLRPLSNYPSLLFIGGMLLATIIEYITSLLMEKLFQTQWWDYSQEPYNFQGRIALIPSLFWGFLSLIAFDFLQPFVTFIIHAIPVRAGNWFLTAALIITAVDIIYSVATSIHLTKQLDKLYHFRMEWEKLLQEGQFKGLYEIISSTTQSFTERMDTFREGLNQLKASYSGSDSRLQAIENKFKELKGKYSNLFGGILLAGTRRIIRAFPSMKFLPSSLKKQPKNKKSIRVREMLMLLLKKK